MLAQLRRLYGDRVEKPTHVHITDWQDDPFAHGSYAYMTVGSTTADHDDLATPDRRRAPHRRRGDLDG